MVAWIEVIDDRRATGELAPLYERMTDPAYGRVDNILQIHSLHPEGMRAHWELYVQTMKSTPTLRKVEREMVAVVVSTINDCHY